MNFRDPILRKEIAAINTQITELAGAVNTIAELQNALVIQVKMLIEVERGVAQGCDGLVKLVSQSMAAVEVLMVQAGITGTTIQ